MGFTFADLQQNGLERICRVSKGCLTQPPCATYPRHTAGVYVGIPVHIFLCLQAEYGDALFDEQNPKMASELRLRKGYCR
jgi:hypothetical protein